jgi:hypothetical protein
LAYAKLLRPYQLESCIIIKITVQNNLSSRFDSTSTHCSFSAGIRAESAPRDQDGLVSEAAAPGGRGDHCEGGGGEEGEEQQQQQDQQAPLLSKHCRQVRRRGISVKVVT